MNTYQIGNKGICIIRAYAPCTIGDTILTYKNEPYTILKDVSLTLTFDEKEKNAKENQDRVLNYSFGQLISAKLTNVHLTDKVLNMLFNQYEDGLKSYIDNVNSDGEGHIFLSSDAEIIYQCFIFNEESEMIRAYGEVNPTNILLPPNENYLVVYQIPGLKSVCLQSNLNKYFTLDIICEGNTDEETAKTYIHVEKAGLTVDRTMYFNQGLNAVDLQFNIINEHNDYIVLK